MRHFGSLLLAAVFAPSIFLLTGTGLSAFNSALDDNKVYDPLGSLAALGALLLAGVLYAILVMARLSPLGPGLAGLASWGISGWALWDIKAYQAFFAQLDVHMGGAVGETGLGIMLGIPLVATLFSGRRWRRRELPAPAPMMLAPMSEPDDAGWMLPSGPLHPATPTPEMQLPEIPPPSLRYPVAAAFQAPPLSPPSGQAPPLSPPSGQAPSWRTPPYIPPPPPPTTPASPASPGSPTPSASPTPAAPAQEPPVLSASMAAALDEISNALRPVSGAPAPIMASPAEAAPLPRRVPANAAAGEDATEQIAPAPPPPDNEVTERLSPPGSMAPQSKRAGAQES